MLNNKENLKRISVGLAAVMLALTMAGCSSAESGDAGVFQVRRFYDPESQRADGPVCPAAFARAAGRHQLLYLPRLRKLRIPKKKMKSRKRTLTAVRQLLPQHRLTSTLTR